jgi:hypothetical protein
MILKAAGAGVAAVPGAGAHGQATSAPPKSERPYRGKGEAESIRAQRQKALFQPGARDRATG